MSRIQLLGRQDFAVAAWTWKTFRLHPLFVNRAFGILEGNELIGSIIFHDYNGYNIVGSYYAENGLTAGLVRALARFVLDTFHVERLTFHIKRSDRKRLKMHLRRFGAVHEAYLRDYFGPGNDGLQYVLFKEQLMKLAGPRYMRARLH